jgi:hypothetical protein
MLPLAAVGCKSLLCARRARLKAPLEGALAFADRAPFNKFSTLMSIG